jgi:hypothetical protein
VTGDDGTVTRLEATRGVVIAVGTRAASPPIDGLDDVETWDNRDVTEVKEIPESAARARWRRDRPRDGPGDARLGADEVTIVEALDHCWPARSPSSVTRWRGARATASTSRSAPARSSVRREGTTVPSP